MSKIFDKVNEEKEKIYREVEEHYITQDIAKQIYYNILEEHAPKDYCVENVKDNVWEYASLDCIYQHWLFENDANLDWWSNIDNAIDAILSEEDKDNLVEAFRSSIRSV